MDVLIHFLDIPEIRLTTPKKLMLELLHLPIYRGRAFLSSTQIPKPHSEPPDAFGYHRSFLEYYEQHGILCITRRI